MIFSNGSDDKVRDGTKTQTRRVVQETDEVLIWNYHNLWTATTVYRNNRTLWETSRTGKTYAIQSGRGKKGNGRFGIVKIRKENLQDINCKDCIAEGLDTRETEYDAGVHLRNQFARLWDSLHKKPGTRWADNPEVWCISFEVVKEN